MCGIVGIQAQSPVLPDLLDSLLHLQHRGQDAAGILTVDERKHMVTGSGRIMEVFNERNCRDLSGNSGIGHTRYPTYGLQRREEVQPFWTPIPYGIGIAHNGQIVNCAELEAQIQNLQGRYLDSTSDTEILLHYLSDQMSAKDQRLAQSHFFDAILAPAVNQTMRDITGAYSVVGVVLGKGLFAFRDPHGIRPLVLGSRKSHLGNKDFIIASENTMFYPLGYRFERDIRPGELVFIDRNQRLQSTMFHTTGRHHPCAFEYVYFARPDATINHVNVYRSRLRMGQNLARQWQKNHPNRKPDVVIPIPSSANTAAHSLAHELGVRYSEGIYKNSFIGRTFIMKGQQQRVRSVRQKLTPQPMEIRNKKVMIVEDSIVRGNTILEIVRMLRDCQCREIYLAVACPPIRFPCFYGVDMPTHEELLAKRNSIAQITEFLDVDALIYLDLPMLIEAIVRHSGVGAKKPCVACFNGEYVTAIPDSADSASMACAPPQLSVKH